MKSKKLIRHMCARCCTIERAPLAIDASEPFLCKKCNDVFVKWCRFEGTPNSLKNVKDFICRFVLAGDF